MVKFSKELEAQLIPEWKEAFMNYWELKKHIKKIKLSKNKSNQLQEDTRHDFGRSILDGVRFAFERIAGGLCRSAEKPEIIKVKKKITRGDEEGEGDELYETELLQSSHEDQLKAFFERLDQELNKVNQFYKTKEGEFLERGDVLKKQLEILQDLKQAIRDRKWKSLASKSPWAYSSSASRSSDCSENLIESSDTDNTLTEAAEENGADFNGDSATQTKTKSRRTKTAMRIDIPVTTPMRTISAVISMIWEDLNNPSKGCKGDFINKKKVQSAEKMIRVAFVELYRGLGLLRTYSSLNMVAFTKILKKFDKVCDKQTLEIYLKVVKRSHFISSDKVIRLMDQVESIFTMHFANDDRKKAMKFLRPQQRKDSHLITFFVGLFTGCFVILFSVYATLAHAGSMFNPATRVAYTETIYPVFSMFALLSLHLFMYGCNLFMWKNQRINYNFIFEFHPSTSLKHRDAFLISTSLMTTVVGAMVLHLTLLASSFSPNQADAIPGILLLIFLAILVCPLNIFYRSTRFCFLRVMRNIVCSPFYKVLMVDFFMADQLTSQIPLLRHMESILCPFLVGSFKMHQYETCKSERVYKELVYVISFAPYYWRAMQCARRWFDEGDINHLANLGKYVSAMVAGGARITYARQSTHLWMVIVLATSFLATVYQLYWDFVKDWGLLNPKSKNPWLRDDLIVKNNSIYYVSIALNLVLRVVWVETMLRFNAGVLESRLLEFCLAALEVVRRGLWNFYRLENEHLNNVGNFRAVKAIPLPFWEMHLDG
ncbi:hypothetical protein NMG60_11031944 [Bertholletia excelsa]